MKSDTIKTAYRSIYAGICDSDRRDPLVVFAFVNQPALSMALGGDRACFQLGLIAFTILYSPLSMILGLVMNAWSRKMNIRQMLLLPGITMVNRSFPA